MSINAKHKIAITSGKGGVGKSMFSANFAISLASMGYKVGLLDGDVYGPNIPRLLKLEDEALKWGETKMIPSENFGIKTISTALTTPSKDTPLVWRGSVVYSAIKQFLEDVDWGELDFFIVDMPPGTGDVQITISQMLEDASFIFVSTPSFLSYDDVSRAVNMAKDMKKNILGLVENMSYFIAPDTLKQYDIFGTSGANDFCKQYSINLLGKIPISKDIADKNPIVAFGNDEQKAWYKNIANEVLNQLKIKAKSSN